MRQAGHKPGNQISRREYTVYRATVVFKRANIYPGLYPERPSVYTKGGFNFPYEAFDWAMTQESNLYVVVSCNVERE